MPEGPSILVVREAAVKFAGKKIIADSGNSTGLHIPKKSVYGAICPSLKNKQDLKNAGVLSVPTVRLYIPKCFLLLFNRKPSHSQVHFFNDKCVNNVIFPNNYVTFPELVNLISKHYLLLTNCKPNFKLKT